MIKKRICVCSNTKKLLEKPPHFLWFICIIFIFIITYEYDNYIYGIKENIKGAFIKVDNP